MRILITRLISPAFAGRSSDKLQRKMSPCVLSLTQVNLKSQDETQPKEFHFLVSYNSRAFFVTIIWSQLT